MRSALSIGRQTPVIAVVVPFVLVWIVDGGRGLKQMWPAALIAGLAFGIAQFVCSNYISVPLSDIVASLVGAAALVALVQVWKPSEVMETRPVPRAARRARGLPTTRRTTATATALSPSCRIC